jgi:hypothetical protein
MVCRHEEVLMELGQSGRTSAARSPLPAGVLSYDRPLKGRETSGAGNPCGCGQQAGDAIGRIGRRKNACAHCAQASKRDCQIRITVQHALRRAVGWYLLLFVRAVACRLV